MIRIEKERASFAGSVADLSLELEVAVAGVGSCLKEAGCSRKDAIKKLESIFNLGVEMFLDDVPEKSDGYTAISLSDEDETAEVQAKISDALLRTADEKGEDAVKSFGEFLEKLANDFAEEKEGK